jgi:CRISPR-associated autoregulator DevR family
MYLTMMTVSRPMLASNNRGENVGNIQTLQKVTTSSGMRTVLSGYAIKRAIRDRMHAEGASMWRRSVEPSPDNAAGYVYGIGDSVVMRAEPPESPERYDDTLLFGYMIQPRGDSESSVRSRGRVEVTDAVSTTVWSGDMGFAQGANANEPQIAPFSYERHLTRYLGVVTVDLTSCAPRLGAVSHLVRSLQDLRVGGSHGAHASSLVPAFLAWRVHPEPGMGGMHPGILDVPVEGHVPESLFTPFWKDYGITPQTAGPGTSRTVAEGLNAILRDAHLPTLE